jgi:hypothetical protein
MNGRWWLVGMLALVVMACSAPAPARTGPLALWDPVDDAFAGCQGACGAHVEGVHADIIAQPGATLGQRTYCPVSGAVFEIAAEHPHVDVDGQTLWFCCAGCAMYFEAHRDEVLAARGMLTARPSQ